MAALLAKDGFLPRQLTGLGDRLVFANGILSLSLAAGVLIVVFGGDSHALIPLFAIGAFLAFTLSPGRHGRALVEASAAGLVAESGHQRHGCARRPASPC